MRASDTTQNGVGRHDAGDGREAAPAQDLAFHGQAAPLVVGEARPSGTMRCAENPVLFEQVVNDRLLLPVDPAGDKKDEERERGRQRVHREACPRSTPRCKACDQAIVGRQLGPRSSRRTLPPTASMRPVQGSYLG